MGFSAKCYLAFFFKGFPEGCGDFLQSRCHFHILKIIVKEISLPSFMNARLSVWEIKAKEVRFEGTISRQNRDMIPHLRCLWSL